MTIYETIESLKRIFGNYELDLPCTDSLNILNQTVMLLEELKSMRNLDKTNFGDGYKKGRQDAFQEIAYSDNVKKEEFEILAYYKGREDAIDECSEALKKWSCDKEDLRSVFEVLEELKEQKNE